MRRLTTTYTRRVDGFPVEVASPLLELDEATFMARTLGRFDVLLTVSTATAGDLVGLLDRLRTHPGVRELESWSHLRFVKESYSALHLGEV